MTLRDEIIDRMESDPFVPFALVMSSGERYEVHDPNNDCDGRHDDVDLSAATETRGAAPAPAGHGDGTARARRVIQRRPTRQITLGDDRVGRVRIGGGLHGTEPAPVSVQTMTAGYTHDVDACVAEINRLAAAGADVVRVAVPGKKDTEALRHIMPQVRVPIVADVHFHFGRALEAGRRRGPQDPPEPRQHQRSQAGRRSHLGL